MTTRTRTTVRLRVDPVACDAYGYCAELLPERVTLDEWGYPIVDGTPVDAELMALATRAVAECPRRAVRFETVAASRSRRSGSAAGAPPGSPFGDP
jgi:ferredoxin